MTTTNEDIISAVADIAKRISDSKPSEIAERIPNVELRNAILDIFEAGWNEGIQFERNRIRTAIEDGDDIPR